MVLWKIFKYVYSYCGLVSAVQRIRWNLHTRILLAVETVTSTVAAFCTPQYHPNRNMELSSQKNYSKIRQFVQLNMNNIPSKEYWSKSFLFYSHAHCKNLRQFPIHVVLQVFLFNLTLSFTCHLLSNGRVIEKVLDVTGKNLISKVPHRMEKAGYIVLNNLFGSTSISSKNLSKPRMKRYQSSIVMMK